MDSGLSCSRPTGSAVARFTGVGKCWPWSETASPALTSGCAVAIVGLKNDGTLGGVTRQSAWAERQ